MGAPRPEPGPRGVWLWGTLDALAAALWSGPTTAFLSAFSIELGAGGGGLGILLALNTLLANGLQLHGAQWTRRGRTTRRVYITAALARGTWLLAGTVPALLALGGRRDLALVVFLGALVVSSVAAAAASPAMAARAAVAAGNRGHTQYLADRMTASWLGAVLGTAGMTGLLAWQPGVSGYAIGFAAAAVVGLLGLGPYTVLLRRAVLDGPGAGVSPSSRLVLDVKTLPGGRHAPGVMPGPPLQSTAVPGGPRAQTSPARPGQRARFGVRVAAPIPRGGDAARPSAPAGPAGEGTGSGGWWRPLARRLGAPQPPALGALVLSAAILQGGAAMIGPAAPIWLVRYLDAPTSFLGSVSLASSLAAMASQRLWARWIDSAGSDRVLSATGGLAACIPLGWLLVREPWVAIPVSTLGGLAWGGYSLAMTSRLLQLAPPADRAAYLGTYAAAIGASSAAGSLLAGAITTAVPLPWLPLVFLLSFVARGLGWRCLPRAL